MGPQQHRPVPAQIELELPAPGQAQAAVHGSHGTTYCQPASGSPARADGSPKRLPCHGGRLSGLNLARAIVSRGKSRSSPSLSTWSVPPTHRVTDTGRPRRVIAAALAVTPDSATVPWPGLTAQRLPLARRPPAGRRLSCCSDCPTRTGAARPESMGRANRRPGRPAAASPTSYCVTAGPLRLSLAQTVVPARCPGHPVGLRRPTVPLAGGHKR
jgi:hypothetical protein